ncbi:MAG: dockerin type I repeat-containing protein, partial [Oscillospiraceae bacterium]
FFRTYHKNIYQEVIDYGQSEEITEQPDDPNTKKRGDVNCDGFVKVDDVILLNRYLTEDVAAVITAQGMINGEMNGDGNVNANDATAILRVVAGLDE